MFSLKKFGLVWQIMPDTFHYFTTSQITDQQMNTCLGDCHLGGPSSCYFFTASDTVKIIKLRIEAWEEIHDTLKNNKWNRRGSWKRKTHDHKAPMWFHLRFFREFTWIFRYCSYLQLGVVATCKPLLCFAMFSLIPLAH